MQITTVPKLDEDMASGLTATAGSRLWARSLTTPSFTLLIQKSVTPLFSIAAMASTK